MFGLRTLKRDLEIKRDVDALIDVAEDGAAHPAHYRDPNFWRRVLTAAAALASVLPLPVQGRHAMNNWMAKAGMIAGTVVAVAGAFQSAPIPAKYQGYAALVGSFAAMLAGLYHPQPGVVATDQPAK